MEKRNQKYTVLLAVAFVAIFSVAIAYAALTQALTITTNKVTQKGYTGGWNVAFDTSGSPVAGTKSPSGASTITCGNATVTANSITIADTTLGKPDDQCTWNFTIKNTGSLVAVLQSLVPNAGSATCNTPTNAGTSANASIVCGKVTYTINDGSGGNLYTGSTIAATSGTQTVRLTAKYTTNTATPTAVNQQGVNFTFTYVPQ